MNSIEAASKPQWLACVCGLVAALAATVDLAQESNGPSGALAQLSSRTSSTMSNPYRMIENWPTLAPDMRWGAAIGIIPDNTGGTWMLFRSEPPINHIDAAGNITTSFGEGLIVQAHGFCMDHDGNLWAGDSGPFSDDPSTRGRGFQIHKFDQNGKLLCLQLIHPSAFRPRSLRTRDAVRQHA